MESGEQESIASYAKNSSDTLYYFRSGLAARVGSNMTAGKCQDCPWQLKSCRNIERLKGRQTR